MNILACLLRTGRRHPSEAPSSSPAFPHSSAQKKKRHKVLGRRPNYIDRIVFCDKDSMFLSELTLESSIKSDFASASLRITLHSLQIYYPPSLQDPQHAYRNWSTCRHRGRWWMWADIVGLLVKLWNWACPPWKAYGYFRFAQGALLEPAHYGNTVQS